MNKTKRYDKHYKFNNKMLFTYKEICEFQRNPKIA